MNNVKDRYITFSNIDCYENAALVLDVMHELFKLKPESKNELWIKFMEKIPQNYRESFKKDGQKDTLYMVCANIFYIYDLFEETNFDKGMGVLEQVEMECC